MKLWFANVMTPESLAFANRVASNGPSGPLEPMLVAVACRTSMATGIPPGVAADMDMSSTATPTLDLAGTLNVLEWLRAWAVPGPNSKDFLMSMPAPSG
jgi:hypothetical protein